MYFIIIFYITVLRSGSNGTLVKKKQKRADVKLKKSIRIFSKEGEQQQTERETFTMSTCKFELTPTAADEFAEKTKQWWEGKTSTLLLLMN